jgi:hypothetical protein
MARRRLAGLLGERLKILPDRCEYELVIGAGQASQSQALKATVEASDGQSESRLSCAHRLIAQTQGCPLAK